MVIRYKGLTIKQRFLTWQIIFDHQNIIFCVSFKMQANQANISASSVSVVNVGSLNNTPIVQFEYSDEIDTDVPIIENDDDEERIARDFFRTSMDACFSEVRLRSFLLHQASWFTKQISMSFPNDAELVESVVQQQVSKFLLRDSYITHEKFLSMNDFRVIMPLGKGAFGKVRLVEHILTGRRFALKETSKRPLVNANQRDRVLREALFLSSISPAITERYFVQGLDFTFQDEQRLYAGMEYQTGGNFMQHLIEKDSFDEKTTAFYIAELLWALHFVHEVGLVHRDFKPENIILTSDGHLRLIDFGLCSIRPSVQKNILSKTLSNIDKKLSGMSSSTHFSPNLIQKNESVSKSSPSSLPSCATSMRLHEEHIRNLINEPAIVNHLLPPASVPSKDNLIDLSADSIATEMKNKNETDFFCPTHPSLDVLVSNVGTPVFMAPEVLFNLGYNERSDMWSLGMIMFECLFAGTPFGHYASDKDKVREIIGDFRRWIHIPPTAPGSKVTTASAEAIDLMKRLICDPRHRLTTSEAMRHPYFAKYGITDFASLYKMTPPMKPCKPSLENSVQALGTAVEFNFHSNLCSGFQSFDLMHALGLGTQSETIFTEDSQKILSLDSLTHLVSMQIASSSSSHKFKNAVLHNSTNYPVIAPPFISSSTCGKNLNPTKNSKLISTKKSNNSNDVNFTPSPTTLSMIESQRQRHEENFFQTMSSVRERVEKINQELFFLSNQHQLSDTIFPHQTSASSAKTRSNDNNTFKNINTAITKQQQQQQNLSSRNSLQPFFSSASNTFHPNPPLQPQLDHQSPLLFGNLNSKWFFNNNNNNNHALSSFAPLPPQNSSTATTSANVVNNPPSLSSGPTPPTSLMPRPSPPALVIPPLASGANCQHMLVANQTVMHANPQSPPISTPQLKKNGISEVNSQQFDSQQLLLPSNVLSSPIEPSPSALPDGDEITSKVKEICSNGKNANYDNNTKDGEIFNDSLQQIRIITENSFR